MRDDLHFTHHSFCVNITPPAYVPTCTQLSVYKPIYMYQPTHPAINLPTVPTCTSPSIYLSTCLPACLSVCLYCCRSDSIGNIHNQAGMLIFWIGSFHMQPISESHIGTLANQWVPYRIDLKCSPSVTDWKARATSSAWGSDPLAQHLHYRDNSIRNSLHLVLCENYKSSIYFWTWYWHVHQSQKTQQKTTTSMN